jgi:ribosomal protein L37E
MKRTFEVVGSNTPGAGGRQRRKGIKCWICYRVSYNPEHLKTPYCPTCNFFHSQDWPNDRLVQLRIRTDPVFAVKLLRAQKMYRLHWRLVHVGLNLARLLRGLMFWKKSVKQVNEL